VLSFRLLGHSERIRAENSHVFCLTANSCDVGTDILTRSAIVNLYYEGNPLARKYSIEDPEGWAKQHRHALLGELIGMVEKWRAAGMPTADVPSRFNKLGWGGIVGGILQVCGEPDFLVNAKESAETLDETRREFGFLVDVMAGHAQGSWTAAELVELCQSQRILSSDIGDGAPRSLSTKMGTIASRYVNQSFATPGGGRAIFRKSGTRNGSVYQVFVDESRNPAEPCGTSVSGEGSAP